MRTNFELSDRLQRDRFSFIVPTLEYRCTCYATGIPLFRTALAQNTTHATILHFFFSNTKSHLQRERELEAQRTWTNKRKTNTCFFLRSFLIHIFISIKIFFYFHLRIYTLGAFSRPPSVGAHGTCHACHTLVTPLLLPVKIY